MNKMELNSTKYKNYIKTMRSWYDVAYSHKERRREKGFGWPQIIEEVDKELIQIFIKKGSTNSALDIGCGEGRFLIFLARTFEKVVGIDISKKAIALSRISTKSMKNIRLKCADIFSFKSQKKFNFILDYSVLSHIPPNLFHDYAKKIESLLEKNGCFLLVAFSTLDKHCPKENYVLHKDQYFNFFSDNDIKQLFPRLSLIDKRKSKLILKRQSVVFKGKMKYSMNHYLLKK